MSTRLGFPPISFERIFSETKGEMQPNVKRAEMEWLGISIFSVVNFYLSTARDFDVDLTGRDNTLKVVVE